VPKGISIRPILIYRGELEKSIQTEDFFDQLGAHFKKGGIFLALKGLYIPAQGNALGKF